MTGGIPQHAGPKWTQDQAIVYEAAIEAINDVIAGYSEHIAAEQDRPAPKASRIDWLEMRTDHAIAIMASLDVADTDNVRHARIEYSGIVRARDNSASS